MADESRKAAMTPLAAISSLCRLLSSSATPHAPVTRCLFILEIIVDVVGAWLVLSREGVPRTCLAIHAHPTRSSNQMVGANARSVLRAIISLRPGPLYACLVHPVQCLRAQAARARPARRTCTSLSKVKARASPVLLGTINRLEGRRPARLVLRALCLTARVVRVSRARSSRRAAPERPHAACVHLAAIAVAKGRLPQPPPAWRVLTGSCATGIRRSTPGI